MKAHLLVDLQEIDSTRWDGAQEPLGYVIEAGKAIQQQEAILG